MNSVFKQASVDPTATTMDSGSVSATQDIIKQPTDHASLVPHAHLPAPETTRESVSVIQDSPCTETTVPNAHLAPSSTTLPRSAFTFVDKTQLTTAPNKSVSA